MRRANNGRKAVYCLVLMILGVLWGQLSYAQFLFDVGQKKLSVGQTAMVQTYIRQIRVQEKALLGEAVPVKMSVALTEQKSPGIVLLNEQTGRCAVLSGFSARFPEAELTPLLIAELKQSVLGDAQEYICVAVDDLSADSPVIGDLKRVSAVTDGVKLPVFRYGSKGDVKTANVADRKLINIFRRKPKFIPIDPSNRFVLEQIKALEESQAYYSYMYLMPDGSKYTYSTVKDVTAPEMSAQNVTVGSSLLFDLALSGMTAQQQTACQYAAEIWGSQLSGTVPVSTYLAFADLGSGVLGSSGIIEWGLINNIWYPMAICNQMAGADVSPDQFDFFAVFNTQYLSDFYFGTDMNGGWYDQDFVTVLLHEMAHGLGFYDLIELDEDGEPTGYFERSFDGDSHPSIYDTFLYYGYEGSRLTALTVSARRLAVQSDALYFDGPNAKSANGGDRIKLYAPMSGYEPGSSVSHWDDIVDFETFMKYRYDYPLHTIGERELGLMKDLGWSLAAASTAPPDVPTGAIASDDTYTDKVRVTWTASYGATSYMIYRSNTSSSSSASQIGTATASPYDDALAVAGTTYYYWVKASNAYGTSGFSNGDSGRRAIASKTLSSITVTGASTVISGNTANFTCTATYSDSSTATVTPTWSLSSTTYATITSGGVLTAKTVSANQCVTVVASYTEGGLTSMAQKSVTIQPSAPTVPAAPTISISGQLLSWAAVSGASYYRVYRATTPFDTPAAITSWQTVTQYSLTDPPSGTIYYYWVKAAPTASDDYASAFSNMRYDTVDNVTVYTIGAEGGIISAQDGGYFYQERLTYTPSLPLPTWVTPVLLVDTTEYTLDQTRVYTFNSLKTVH